MEMTIRLLQTGLNLQAQGQHGLAALMLAQVPEELADRNRLLEQRLYPSLSQAASLTAENRRLERLARAQAWSCLLEALEIQLERERAARHSSSLRPPHVQAI